MFILRPKSRPCGDCKKCCEGWLTGEAYGAKFYPGKVCNFLGSAGCSIYPVRPYSPCQTFECWWKRNYSWPDWLRPSQSNVIFVERLHEGEQYIRGFSTSKDIKPEVFLWVKEWSSKTGSTVVVPREIHGLLLDKKRYMMSVYGPNQKIRDHYASLFDLVE